MFKVSDPDKFKSIGTSMMMANTEGEYIQHCDAMTEFCSQETADLKPWLAWWKQRARHIFRAYKPIDAPNVNLSEVGHAKMTNEFGGARVTLIESCRFDVIMFTKQQVDFDSFKCGLTPSGRGPNRKKADELLYKRQMQCARAYGKELTSGPVDANKIPPKKKYIPRTGIHRPANKRKSTGVAKRVTKKKIKTMLISPKVYRKASRRLMQPIRNEDDDDDDLNDDEHAQNDGDEAFTKIVHSISSEDDGDNGDVENDYACETFTEPYQNNEPFYVVLNPADGTKKCAGCDLEFKNNAKAPFNMVLQHSERYQYPREGKYVWSKSKMHKTNYHPRDVCVMPRHPYFTAALLCIDEETTSAMTPAHSAVLLDGFK